MLINFWSLPVYFLCPFSNGSCYLFIVDLQDFLVYSIAVSPLPFFGIVNSHSLICLSTSVHGAIH